MFFKEKNLPIKSGIYKLTNKFTNQIYIGKAKNLKERVPQHKYASVNQIYVDKSIKKYGWNNFEVEIEHYFDENVNDDILFALETAFIDFYECLVSQGGYNIKLFGRGQSGLKVSEETKAKIRKKRALQVISEEQKNKISNSMKGEKNHFYGKTHSLESKEKIRNANSGKTNRASYKKIKQINKETGKIIKIWESITIAAKELKLNAAHIVSVCKKNIRSDNTILRSTGGFKWEYAE